MKRIINFLILLGLFSSIEGFAENIYCPLTVTYANGMYKWDDKTYFKGLEIIDRTLQEGVYYFTGAQQNIPNASCHYAKDNKSMVALYASTSSVRRDIEISNNSWIDEGTTSRSKCYPNGKWYASDIRSCPFKG